MQSIIQILKLNEPRPWEMNGNKGVSHTAECVLLNEHGGIEHVGVLKIKGEDMIKKAQVGTYTASFAVRANPASRVLEAIVTDLTPLPSRSPAGASK